MKETKLHPQRKFLALGLAISKILCNFTSLKQTYIAEMAQTKGFIHKLAKGIVPPYRCYNGAMSLHECRCFSNGTGNALFMFAKVKGQPFNGSFV